MPRYVKLREVSENEKDEIRRLAGSRRAAARLVQRAKIIQQMIENPRLSASEAGRSSGYAGPLSGIKRVKRFNELGVAGLEDEARPGRPVIHDETAHRQLIDRVMQKPSGLGYRFKVWTLERLQIAMQKRHNLYIALSTIWEWLEADGVDWKRQESWFQDPQRHDPQFIEK